MNETFKTILDTAKEAALWAGEATVDGACCLGRAAGDLVDRAKQKLRLATLEGAVEGALAEVGELLYATHTGTPTDSQVLQEKLEKIDALKAEIIRLEGAAVCPICGAAARSGDVFCRECGGKL